MENIRNLFRKKLAFAPIDPLGDGLREMIQREQAQPTAFSLYDDDLEVGRFWHQMEEDLRSGDVIEFH